MDEQASRIADPVLIASDSLSLLLLLDMMANIQVRACARYDYKCTVPSGKSILQALVSIPAPRTTTCRTASG